MLFFKTTKTMITVQKILGKLKKWASEAPKSVKDGVFKRATKRIKVSTKPKIVDGKTMYSIINADKLLLGLTIVVLIAICAVANHFNEVSKQRKHAQFNEVSKQRKHAQFYVAPIQVDAALLDELNPFIETRDFDYDMAAINFPTKSNIMLPNLKESVITLAILEDKEFKNLSSICNNNLDYKTYALTAMVDNLPPYSIFTKQLISNFSLKNVINTTEQTRRYTTNLKHFYLMEAVEDELLRIYKELQRNKANFIDAEGNFVSKEMIQIEHKGLYIQSELTHTLQEVVEMSETQGILDSTLVKWQLGYKAGKLAQLNNLTSMKTVLTITTFNANAFSGDDYTDAKTIALYLNSKRNFLIKLVDYMYDYCMDNPTILLKDSYALELPKVIN